MTQDILDDGGSVDRLSAAGAVVMRAGAEIPAVKILLWQPAHQIVRNSAQSCKRWSFVISANP